MKVIVDLPEELFDRVNKNVKGSSISNFIVLSIENQLNLEEGASNTIIELNRIESRVPSSGTKTRTDIRAEELETTSPLEEKIRSLRILSHPIDKISTMPGRKIQINDRYIWGQYNKFLPIKFSVRELALAQEQHQYSPVELEIFQDQCSRDAQKMKGILQVNDDRHQRKYGEQYTAGFPGEGDNSLKRYIHHFIGYAQVSGHPVGALADLGFVIIENETICLTDSGWEFAIIRNPILDDDPLTDNLLSNVEKRYLIDYLQKNLKKEWGAVVYILNSIERGQNTPDFLNAVISSMNTEWTDKVVNTMRTGFLGRMSDLGLIERDKQGTKSMYRVSEFGKTMMEVTKTW